MLYLAGKVPRKEVNRVPLVPEGEPTLLGENPVLDIDAFCPAGLLVREAAQPTKKCRLSSFSVAYEEELYGSVGDRSAGEYDAPG